MKKILEKSTWKHGIKNDKLLKLLRNSTYEYRFWKTNSLPTRRCQRRQSSIIEITNKQELFEDELEKSYDEGYSEGYKDGKADGEDETESDGYQDGYSDGYEKAKAEFESPNIEKLKKEIEDEYYQKGYISTDVYYQKIIPNREPNFENQNDIAHDDLPF